MSFSSSKFIFIIRCFIICSSTFLLQHVASAQKVTLEEICDDCQLELFASCGGFLEGPTVDQSNTLWVVDLLSGNILSIDDNGNCTVQANTGGQANGAKFHQDGRLFIADKNSGILAFDPTTGKFEEIAGSYRSEHLRGTNDLIFDSKGGLYFTEPYGSSTLEPNGRVFYLPGETGARLELFADNLAYPNGIALSPDGNRVYVGEFASKRLVSLPSLQSEDIFDIAFELFRLEGGVGPDGFTLDTAGNIYTAVFQAGQIQINDTLGFNVGSLSLPDEAGTFVTNLTFKDNYLYITEASLGQIWRVKVNTQGLPFYHQR